MWIHKHKEYYFTVRGLTKERSAGDEGDVLAFALTGSKCASLEYFVVKLSEKCGNVADP